LTQDTQTPVLAKHSSRKQINIQKYESLIICYNVDST